MYGGKPKYVIEHENLVAALRAARRMTAYENAASRGQARGPPPKMPVIQDMPDDRIQCKYCGRRFGPEQYERHVRSCSASAPIPRVTNRGPIKAAAPRLSGARPARLTTTSTAAKGTAKTTTASRSTAARSTTTGRVGTAATGGARRPRY